MKNIIIIVILAGLFTSTSLARILDGGVSDGGGNTISEMPISMQELIESVELSSPLIAAWIQALENKEYPQGPKISASLYKKLFPKKGKNLLQVYLETGLEWRTQGPCFNNKQEPREGSIFADQTNFICLSPFLIQKNSNTSFSTAQVSALLIHEVSHLLNTTEAEAETLQALALQDFRKFHFDTTVKNLRKQIDGPQGGHLDKLLSYFYPWTHFPENLAARDVMFWMLNFNQNLDLLLPSVDLPLQFLPTTKTVLLEAYQLKISVIVSYLHSVDPQYDEDTRQEFKNRLQETFNGRTTLTARELLMTVENRDPGPEFDKVTLRHCHSKLEASQELQEIEDFIQSLREDVSFISTFKSKSKIK